MSPDLAIRLRALPQVQRLLELPEAQALAISRTLLTDALRHALAEVRGELVADMEAECPPPAQILARAAALVADGAAPRLRRVINATGVVVHTNLGRAPLAQAAIDAVGEVARGYSNLEFDLGEGTRGSRTQGVEPLLRELTGAQAALAVNNAAAAVLLALSALAGGGEVVVSRGELVEIGGGFRIPDVIAQGGARLVEVGTTNKTRIGDYAAAITPDTRVLLKVHQSNYRITGFTAEASLEELAALARERSLLLVHDLGSGAMVDLSRWGRPAEPTARDSLRAGADLVAFSGDKLMGGPQAGLLVGQAAALARLRRHPLLRAVRLDKMTLAALEATLRLYRDPDEAVRAVPVLRALAASADDTRARAEQLRAMLAGTGEPRIEASTGYVGGGTLPDQAVVSHAVTLSAADLSCDRLASRLRGGRPAVVGRVARGLLLLDMLVVGEEELPDLAAAVRAALLP